MTSSTDTISGGKIPPPVPLAAVRRAVEVVFSTSFEDTATRRGAMDTLEKANMHCTPEEYSAFYTAGLTLDADAVADAVEKQSILYFYEAAFDKIKREVETTVPAPGTVLLWHVYNMGYVVRTPKACFAIDLHHRRSKELIPLLDFLLVTHDHSDHHTECLLDGLARAGKPVISNFYPRGTARAGNRTLELGTTKIHTVTTDHNRKLLRFVQTYEVELETGGGRVILFIGGDSCNPEQFSMQNPDVDVFIVHPRVGLDVAAAQQLVNPRLTLISHLLELGHFFDQWRWSYDIGFSEMERSRQNGRDCAIPLWGDRIVIGAAR